MGIQTALDSISNNAGSPYGFKNRIINGSMMVDQRNAGASVTPTSGDYTIDRFRSYHTQASKYSVRQMEALDSGASNYESGSAPTGFKNALKVTSSSAYSITSSDYFTIRQRIEGLNCFDLNWGTSTPQTVTLSFWVRSSLTGTFGGTVMNSAGNRNYPFSYTINSSNTWEQKSVTIPGDTTGAWLTTNGVGIQVIFSLGTGSTYLNTSGTWTASESYGATGQVNLVATNAATWYMTGLQLEKGSTATSFDYRDYGRELQLCQRYFIGYGGTTGYERFAVGLCNNTTGSSASTFLPVQMRAQPTLGYSAVGHFGVYDGGNVYTVTGIAFDQQTNLIANMQFTVASGLTTNRPAQIVGNNTTSARLTFNSEL